MTPAQKKAALEASLGQKLKKGLADKKVSYFEQYPYAEEDPDYAEE